MFKVQNQLQVLWVLVTIVILIGLLASGHQRQPVLFHRETFYSCFYKSLRVFFLINSLKESRDFTWPTWCVNHLFFWGWFTPFSFLSRTLAGELINTDSLVTCISFQNPFMYFLFSFNVLQICPSHVFSSLYPCSTVVLYSFYTHVSHIKIEDEFCNPLFLAKINP